LLVTLAALCPASTCWCPLAASASSQADDRHSRSDARVHTHAHARVHIHTRTLTHTHTHTITRLTHAPTGTSSLSNDVLVAPVIPGEKKRTEELRTKLEATREKKKIEEKLRSIKTLGEADEEDDSAASWVRKR
jgi:hypothetical protein